MPHVHELYDFTTSAFIVYNGSVLLVQHKKIGKWLQPGGHIELDEDPLEALWREIEEETGLDQRNLEIVQQMPERPSTFGKIKVLPVPFDLNVHWFNDSHRHIDLSYMMRSKTDEVRLEKDGALAIGWFDPDQLAAKRKAGQMFEHTYAYCLFVLEQLANK